MRSNIRSCSTIAAAVALSGCMACASPQVVDRGEGERASDDSDKPIPISTESVEGNSTSAPYDSRWVVTPRGFGPVQVGMSVAEAERALGGTVDILDDTAECEYISPPGWPAGVSFMIVDGQVVRVDVRTGPVATAEGIRIGSTEAEVDALYPGQVEVRPHKYTTGHYLIVTPAVSDDMRLRIVFETNGELVERYRAGLLPEVEWVEGCS